ncbi:hypothetical protein H5410_020776 [Solanum commersonii]|uniref:Uncharacterized protein n=1 Tax=Solanum commersonii TaxID=4109 RepID=A0A9J5ZC35_SOLCO|nr:hypothetical protein H5410_020776 [Solanum commersonii]
MSNKTWHQIGMYRYRFDTSQVSFRSGSLREETGHRESVLRTGRNRIFIPIIPLYEIHYGNYQENEEVEIDEDEEVDLDDTPTSPDLNSTKVPLVGTSRPPIIPTRSKTKKEWFAYLSSLGVNEDSSIGASVRGSNMVQGELITLNSSGPLTHQTYNKDRDRENFAKIVVVCGLPFSFGEHPSFIAYIRETYNPSFTGLSRGMKHCQYLRAYFEIMNCKVVVTIDMGRSPNGIDYLIVTAH